VKVVGATMSIDTNIDANLDLPSSLRAGLKDAKPVALALAPSGTLHCPRIEQQSGLPLSPLEWPSVHDCPTDGGWNLPGPS
jgi:hypothetical protein